MPPAMRFFAAAATALTLACGASETGSETGRPEAPASQPAPAAPAAPAAAAPDAAREAAEIFGSRCVTCHGAQGAGDGPGSKGLTPAPRNFQEAEWQASVTDEHIQTIVLYGGAAVGRSPVMPGNPDLQGKPAVVAALVEHIRGLAN